MPHSPWWAAVHCASSLTCDVRKVCEFQHRATRRPMVDVRPLVARRGQDGMSRLSRNDSVLPLGCGDNRHRIERLVVHRDVGGGPKPLQTTAQRSIPIPSGLANDISCDASMREVYRAPDGVIRKRTPL
jgi:hypothetical protein